MTQGYRADLPSELISHVRAGCGSKGEAWLAELPTIIRRLESSWSISVKIPFRGIEFNFVAPAIGENGEAVVIKIAPPWEPVEIHCEAAYLRARNGVGCVRLLAEQPESRAILIERIFPGTSLWEQFQGREPEAVTPAIEALKLVLKPVPVETRHIASLEQWFDNLRRYPGTGFPEDYARKALGVYDRFSSQPGRTFYLHGDFHPGNIVAHGDSSFCVIDPKGCSGHIGYEIAVFLNNFHWWQETIPDVRLRLDHAVRQFSEVFDIDALELRQWAYAQMVIGAWWNFIDMPTLYSGSVVKADVWDI